MTQGEWLLVLLFLGAAAYNWVIKAKASRAWFFFGLACISMAAAGEKYPQWHRLALAIGGLISFGLAFLSFTRSRKGHQLGQAVLDGNLPRVRELLHRGTSPNLATLVAYGPNNRESHGGTPLMVAAAQGFAEIVGELLTCGARVNDTDTRGWTALIFAAENGHAMICKLLLDSGADPDIRTRQSGTALMVAALKGHGEVVRMLLENGADASARDSIGKSALDLAQQYGHRNVVGILTQSGRQGQS